MTNKRDVINTVAGSSSSSKRKTPESRDESPLLPPPEFPTPPVLDTDLRLGVGPHAPCTEAMSSPLTSLTLSLNGDGLKEVTLPSNLHLHQHFADISLKPQNEHAKGMLEEIYKRENQRAAIQLKEKDKEIDAARARIDELEQMVESLPSINHMLMAELGEVARLMEALGIVGGNGVPAYQYRWRGG